MGRSKYNITNIFMSSFGSGANANNAVAVREGVESIVELDRTDKKFVTVPGIINCHAVFIIPENCTNLYVTHISQLMAQGQYYLTPFAQLDQFIHDNSDQKFSVIVFDERGWFKSIHRTLELKLEGMSVEVEFVILNPRILGPIVNDKLTSCYTYDIVTKTFYLDQKNTICLGTLERLRTRMNAGSIADVEEKEFIDAFNQVYRPGKFGMIGKGHFGRNEKTQTAIFRRKMEDPESATGKAVRNMQLNLGK